MANTISQAFVEQFKGELLHLAQQKGSRLRAHVNEQPVNAETFNFERLGNVAAVQKTSRQSVTPILNVPHSRRKATMTDWQWADLIDSEDKIRMLIKPENNYAMSGANSMGRTFDELLIAAALGNATDGNGASVALPAAQKIAASSAGLTLDKLIETKEIMDSSEVDPDEERIFVVTAKQITDLLKTTEVKSADYNSIKSLVQGQVDTFMGFKFIRTQLLSVATVSSVQVRSCFAYSKPALGLGVGQNVITSIDKRPDLSNATQVLLKFSAGCTRIEDAGVVEVKCNE